jgi:hypothetical protein
MSFSDAQRAAIFVRDRAICSFTGKSLWILDYGATPFWDYDWADHIRPVSRGGKSVLENGACVASERNWSRRNNGADNQYLFHAGRPTEDCIYELGEIPAEVARRLRRFTALEPSDWYFNRALSSILVYLQDRWDGERGYVRGERYWCQAAARKLSIWRRLTAREDYRSFERRGLVSRTPPVDVALMLELRSIDAGRDETDAVVRMGRRLYPYYRANAEAVWRFSTARTSRHRATLLRSAARSRWISATTLLSLQRSHMRLIDHSPAP